VEARKVSVPSSPTNETAQTPARVAATSSVPSGVGEVERDVSEARRGRATETAIEIDRNGHGTLLS
jgi:hypothetical protein